MEYVWRLFQLCSEWIKIYGSLRSNTTYWIMLIYCSLHWGSFQWGPKREFCFVLIETLHVSHICRSLAQLIIQNFDLALSVIPTVSWTSFFSSRTNFITKKNWNLEERQWHWVGWVGFLTGRHLYIFTSVFRRQWRASLSSQKVARKSCNVYLGSTACFLCICAQRCKWQLADASVSLYRKRQSRCRRRKCGFAPNSVSMWQTVGSSNHLQSWVFFLFLPPSF